MTDCWQALDEELAAWHEAGREASFWLRDDDAVADTPALRRLIEIGDRTGAPIALAVIPKDAGEDLAHAVAASDGVWVMQHGWCHANHATPSEKKFELGDHRPTQVVGEELQRGDERLSGLFGGRYAKVLAPPWNRIGPNVAAHLGLWGYAGLSVFGPRTRSLRPNGVRCANTHIDIIDWKGTRGFRGDEAVVGQALEHLQARRSGEVDPGEPSGLITHHLVHDDDCWAFIERFIDRTRQSPSVRWMSLPDVFGLAE